MTFMETSGILSSRSGDAPCHRPSRPHKTVIQFINELRIGYAHKLLVETQLNADQVCCECGFNNVFNFYEQFQKITLRSRHKFRKEHNEKAVIVR